ncbi:MAG TPA: hypothetical protein VHV83_16365 [Armatimonadota bacterium]|nr:hypothetical protein [Armatimonadota bacterium]
MFPIRCPECGQINFNDDLSYPHCSQCHEDLARCTYCRHHEGNGCKHPKAYSRFTPDGDAAKNCPEFRSRGEIRGSQLMAKLPAPLWVSALVLVILLSLTAATWFVDPAERYFLGNPLRVETAIPQEVLAGEPFQVTMRVTNLLNRPSSRIYVEIDNRFLSAVDWEMPQPQPERIDSDHNRLLLEYDSLPPNGQRTLLFTFTPRQASITPFTAKIFAPSNRLRHTMKIPILMAQRSALNL